MHIDAVIFDMDGLMVDTENLAIEAWQAAAQAHGVEMPRAVCTALIGLNQRDSERFIANALGPAFPLEAVRDDFLHRLQQRVDSGDVLAKPGLHELLDFLEEHAIPKAVATSAERGEARKKLEAVHVLHRFPVLATSDQVHRGKPAPDLFLLAAERLGVSPVRCTVLEDSEAGIKAAAAAGMRAILVPDIKHPSPDVAAMAAHICPSLVHVREVLAREKVPTVT
ncbi:HAD family phosphatase [Dyella sp. 2HG41-7]|uniref:HAD family hydrolase n=1 Tax=Dyella sp. 2HG41-7 TaxID=2883239 RepID=UPI001F200D10|nr:HAD family phosphatase [Dyella sp. 2HG41-7]